MANVLFININESLPTFSSDYIGWFVVDSTNKLYLGVASGWEELTNKTLVDSISEINDKLGDIDTILDNINGEVI